MNDEQFVSFDLEDGGLIILSTLDSLVIGKGSDIGDDYTAKSNVKIYAEDILISNTFKANNIQLSACSITGVKGILDLSGKNGETPDVPVMNDNEKVVKGESGGLGANGGQAKIYIEELNPTLFNLKINANGGNGGKGQSSNSYSEGGDGGNGGNGGEVYIIGTSIYTSIIKCLHESYQSENVLDKIKGLQSIISLKDDLIEKSIVSALENLFEILFLKKENKNLSEQVEAIKKYFSNNRLGEVKENVKKLNDTLKEIIININVLDNLWQNGIVKSNVDVAGGHKGHGGNGKTMGKDGEDGKVGEANFFGELDTKSAIKRKNFPCVHPDQCLMLLQKAKMHYFSADSINNVEGYKKAAILLDRLIKRTEAFEDDEVAEYYSSIEKDIKANDSVTTFRSIFQEADALLNQLKNGLDFYGNKDNEVPLVSLSFYKSQFKVLLENLDKMETAYNNYCEDKKNTQKAVDALKEARQLAKSRINQYEIKIKEQRDTLKVVADNIAYFNKKAENMKTKVEDAINKVKDKINMASGYNIEDFLSTIAMCGFAPKSALLIASQLGEFFYKSNSTIDTYEGIHIKKEYIVKNIRACEADLDSLKQEYKQLKDGTLKVEDIGGTKLLVEEERLMNILEQFYNKFPNDIDNVKNIFQDYINITLERNEKIIEYNSIISNILNLIISNKTNQLKINKINDDTLSIIDFTFPYVKNYMKKIYDEARVQILHEIYLVEKAYRYWALSNNNFIATTFGNNPISKITSPMLRAAQGDILNLYAMAKEERGRDAQTFPSNPNEQGLFYKFDKNKLNIYIDQLKEDNEIDFKIKAVLPSTTKEESVFAGIADIRMTKVRAWIKGIKTNDNEVRIDIIHCGKEEIVNSEGDLFCFTHKPVTTMFVYNNKDNRIRIDGDIGKKEGSYAPLSPFTTWRIKVDPIYNKGLDLSEVTDIQIELWGTGYAFS